MRDDCNIYVLCHKNVDYNIPNNSLYIPIQCGKELAEESICEVHDNDIDGGISEWNPFYLETTASYWISKHYWNISRNLKYLGQCQYRRQLLFDENTDFDYIFKQYDAIVAAPYILYNNVYTHYKRFHNINDLKIIEYIINKGFPDYKKDMELVFNGNKLFYSGGFILKVEDYCKYINFYFAIMELWKKILNINDISDVRKYVEKNISEGNYGENANLNIDYQMRIGGYLAERIFSIFVSKNFKTLYYKNYVKPEGGY